MALNRTKQLEKIKDVNYKDLYKIEMKAGKVWFTPKDPQRDMLLGVVDSKGGDKGIMKK